VPDDADEAMRDLVRAREDAVVVGRQAKHRLKAFLLRQGRRYPGRDGWTLQNRRWLADLSFPTTAQHVTLEEYRTTIDETERRIERVTEQLRHLAPTWRWAPVVAALQALRGVSFVTAVALVAELGDVTRFGHPRELMAYLGSCRRNIPAARVSAAAPSRRRAIRTSAGCSRKRPGPIRGFHGLDVSMRIGRKRCRKSGCDIAWKAQLRLTSRFRRLVARGKAKPKVATAIARELTGFVWAIAREVSPAPR
jgi:transposase